MPDTKDANAGTEQNLTDAQDKIEGAGTSDGTQSLSDPKVVEGLNRSISAKNKVIKDLTDKLAASEAAQTAGEADSINKELSTAKKDLAKAKTLLKYKDVAEQLEKVLDKGVDPEVIDDDFVSMFRTKPETEAEEDVQPHNPGRATPTDLQSAERLLKSIPSLFY